MVERVILHIGMNKTGSTSIQNSLDGYDDGATFYARLGKPNHSIAMVTAFTQNLANLHYWKNRGTDFETAQAEREEIRSRLSDELSRSDRKTVVISGEDISKLEAEETTDLLDFLGQNGRDVHVVGYIRDPVSYCASAFQQRAKSNQTNDLKTISPLYVFRFEAFAKAVPSRNLNIAKYDPRAFPNGSVLADFAAKAGLDRSRITERRANVSTTLPAVSLLLAFNASNPCSNGDLVTFQARNRLVNQITKAYATRERIEPANFACISDFSEIDYVKSRFGIEFDPSPDPRQMMSRKALQRYLALDAAFDLAPLRDLLEVHGITGDFADAKRMMNRLYYHMVHLETALQERGRGRAAWRAAGAGDLATPAGHLYFAGRRMKHYFTSLFSSGRKA